MSDYDETYEIEIDDVDDLISSLAKKTKDDAKSFEDIVILQSALNRELYLGDIDAGTGSSIEGYIRFWNNYDNKNSIPIEDRKPIKIYIDSNGGYLRDALTIIDAIRISKTPVYTINIGCAYSGGFFVFIAGHKRFAYPNSTFLFHEGATSNGGTSGQFENYTEFYKRLLEKVKNIVLKYTNITPEEYAEIKREDIWYDAQDGINKGFIDEIVEEFV